MRCVPHFLVLLAFALVALGMEAALPAGKGHASTAAPTEFSAQAKERRVRPRIRVTPLYPYRTFNSPYPLPYEIEYPGPGAVRDCRSRLFLEARPSGTVIVPRTRCVWVRP